MSVQSHTSAEVIQHTVNPRCLLEFFTAGITAVIPVRILLRIEIQNKCMLFSSIQTAYQSGARIALPCLDHPDGIFIMFQHGIQHF